MDEKEFFKQALCASQSQLCKVLIDLNNLQNTENLVEELIKRMIHKTDRYSLDVIRKPEFNFSGDPTHKLKIKKYRIHIYEVEE